MNRRWTCLVILLAGSGCKGCIDIPLPDTPDPVEVRETPPPDTALSTPDTAPDAPCELPEVEPNNGFEDANDLPMEVQACGIFESNVDADFWTFELSEPAWLGIEVEAFRLGSEADVSLVLSSEDNTVNLGINYHHGTPDVFVRFPSPAGRYNFFVRQTVGTTANPGQGPDYFYELMATSAKAPVRWDIETEANESLDEAMLLVDEATGDEPLRVLGNMSSLTDQEWFRIDVPSGRHRLELDIDAHEQGSIGNFRVALYDSSGRQVIGSGVGEVGWELDPWLEYRTIAAETMYVQVIEESGAYGIPVWYVLSVTVEEDG